MAHQYDAGFQKIWCINNINIYEVNIRNLFSDQSVVLCVSIERIAFTFERSSCQWVSHDSMWGSGGKVPRALHLGNRCLLVICLTPLQGMEPRSLGRPTSSHRCGWRPC